MGYYKPCKEFDECNELIEKYYLSGQFEKCFEGHLKIAEATHYPLAECQVGYFYSEGIGVEKNPEKAFYWTKSAAEHGDRDAQYNLAIFLETGFGCKKDAVQAKVWCEKAAAQGQKEAADKCKNNQA